MPPVGKTVGRRAKVRQSRATSRPAKRRRTRFTRAEDEALLRFAAVNSISVSLPPATAPRFWREMKSQLPAALAHRPPLSLWTRFLRYVVPQLRDFKSTVPHEMIFFIEMEAHVKSCLTREERRPAAAIWEADSPETIRARWEAAEAERLAADDQSLAAGSGSTSSCVDDQAKRRSATVREEVNAPTPMRGRGFSPGHQTRTKRRAAMSSCGNEEESFDNCDDPGDFDDPGQGRDASPGHGDEGPAPFSAAEERCLLEWLLEAHCSPPLAGRQIWKDLEMEGHLPGRNWESLRHHFATSMLGRLEEYDWLTEKQRFQLRYSYRPRKKPVLPRREYSYEEDVEILYYVSDELFPNYLENGSVIYNWKMWDDMSACVFSYTRSWGSLQGRFFKQIMPNYKRYRKEFGLSHLSKIQFCVDVSKGPERMKRY